MKECATGDATRDHTIATMQKHNQFSPAWGEPAHCSMYRASPVLERGVPPTIGCLYIKVLVYINRSVLTQP
jgi:hypothetical protein